MKRRSIIKGQLTTGCIRLVGIFFIRFRDFSAKFYIWLDLMPWTILIHLLKFGSHIGFHPSSVKTFLFLKITDIEAICDSLDEILNFEVEPMEVSFGVAVNSHEQIILILIYLSYDRFTLKTQSKFPDSNKESNIRYYYVYAVQCWPHKNLSVIWIFLGAFICLYGKEKSLSYHA